MKIIVSHDVDHLYGSDHYKDLIYPKLWVRETLSFLKRNITFSQWWRRLLGVFSRERNYIEQLMIEQLIHHLQILTVFYQLKVQLHKI